MAATNIAASHVTFTKIKEMQLYGPENVAGEHIRFVHGTLTVNVGSGNTAVYTTAAQIPLDNLFDPTHASFIDIDEKHVWTDKHFWIGNGAINYQCEWNFASKKAEVQMLGGNQTVTSTTIAAVAASSKLTSTAIFPLYFTGQLVTVEGFSTATNGAIIARVGAGSDTSNLIIDPVNKTTVSDEAAGNAITVSPLVNAGDPIAQLTEAPNATDFLVQTMTATVTIIGRKKLLP